MKDWEKDLIWFQKQPAPERKPLEELIRIYLDTNDETYFEAFLHYFEPLLNTKVMGYVQRFSLEGHFADLKAAYVEGLVKALESYDPSFENLFLQYKEYIVREVLMKYIRTMRTGFTIPSDYEFRMLRKVMRLYNENGRQNTDAEIQQIAKKMELKPKKVKELLQAGLRNEHMVDFYQDYEEEDSESSREDVTRDWNLNPEHIFFEQWQWDLVMNAFELLTPRQKNVVAAHCGFCENCYGTKRGITFKEIATNNGLASAESAENIYKKSIRSLRKEIVPELINWEYENS